MQHARSLYRVPGFKWVKVYSVADPLYATSHWLAGRQDAGGVYTFCKNAIGSTLTVGKKLQVVSMRTSISYSFLLSFIFFK